MFVSRAGLPGVDTAELEKLSATGMAAYAHQWLLECGNVGTTYIFSLP